MNLTPEQLAAYQAYVNAHQGANAAYVDPTTGQTIMDAGGSGWNGGGDGALSVGDYKPGGSYDYYDKSGKSLGMQGQYGMPQGLGKELAMYGAILAGVGAAGGMFGGAGLFGGGGAAGEAGATGGGFLGDATAAGYGGLDAGSAATMGGGASINGGAALGAAGAGGAAGLGAGGAGGAGTAATTGGLLGGTSSLLGPAAAVLGGLAGAQGQKAGGTMEHKMDPRLDPAVFGEGGLVPRAQGLLAQQMDPARMQGYRQMQTAGMGLLNQPVAGNGFSRFSSR